MTKKSLFALTLMSVLALGPGSQVARAEQTFSPAGDSQCIENKVREMLKRGMVDEAVRLNPQAGAGVFYLPGVAACNAHDSTWPSAGPPRLVRAYWERQAQIGQTASCPKPFGSVNVRGYNARTGCRPIAGETSACAIAAYTADEETSPHDVQVPLQNGIVDVDFYEFAKFHMTVNRDLYPEVSDCF